MILSSVFIEAKCCVRATLGPISVNRPDPEDSYVLIENKKLFLQGKALKAYDLSYKNGPSLHCEYYT